VEGDYGWPEIKRRHRISSGVIVSAYKHLNLLELSDYPSSAVQAMIMPEGCDSSEFIESLAERYNVILSGGQGDLKGRIIRSGFTGLYSGEFLSLAVKNIGKLLDEEGFEVNQNAAAAKMREIADQKDIF
jgi:aspartate aminotransferase-like enzyme